LSDKMGKLWQWGEGGKCKIKFFMVWSTV